MVMINNQSTDIEQQLRKIANILLLNGTLVDCPGLIHGKTGVAVFFFFYAQHTGNRLFEDYALDLIGEIQEQIHVNSPADYEKGIAGIGVGIDYFMRNGFLDADDDIFDDFDQRMYRAVMYDPCQDFSLYDGLTGYGRYWIMRLNRQSSLVQARECLSYITGKIKQNLPDIPEKERTEVYCFQYDLSQIQGFDVETRLIASLREQCRIQLADNRQSFLRLRDSTVGSIIRIHQRNHYFVCSSHDDNVIALKQIQDLDMGKPSVSMGLLDGYAGEGMLRLTALNQTNLSWMLLL